ncbi:hypothetical protein BASA61_003163 [Batrachochytrium salamandrivorans]|nr:hypothetical protein BASA61_003163 [Batrachochytrium salamandrivorans]
MIQCSGRRDTIGDRLTCVIRRSIASAYGGAHSPLLVMFAGAKSHLTTITTLGQVLDESTPAIANPPITSRILHTSAIDPRPATSQNDLPRFGAEQRRRKTAQKNKPSPKRA